MRHSVILEGFGIRLRPVTLDDANFIVSIRNAPHVKGKIGDIPYDVELQKKWIENYFNVNGDYYFIVESLSSIPQGTIGVTLHDKNQDVIGPGRLVMLPNSLAALPTSILINNFCFDNLNLNILKGVVICNNDKVLSFDKRLGYKIVGYSKEKLFANGSMVNLLRIELTKKDWRHTLPNLVKLANRCEKMQIK